MQNRIFRKPAPKLRRQNSCFVDVSSIAFSSGYPFRTHVSREILGSYTIPGIADDDEGLLVVEGLLGEMFAVISGTVPGEMASYGKSFSVTFEFVAQHRRRATPQTLTLRALCGPCDADSEIYVWLVPDISF